jgi:hypothetical protein
METESKLSSSSLPSEHGEREGEVPSGSAGGGGDASPYEWWNTLNRRACERFIN